MPNILTASKVYNFVTVATYWY